MNYVNGMGSEQPQVSEAEYEDLKKAIFKPLETYQVGRNEIVAGTVSPSYLLPIHGLQRLEKIMDEYVGGIRSHYTTNTPLLTRGLELLTMLKEASTISERKTFISFRGRGSCRTGSWLQRR